MIPYKFYRSFNICNLIRNGIPWLRAMHHDEYGKTVVYIDLRALNIPRHPFKRRNEIAAYHIDDSPPVRWPSGRQLYHRQGHTVLTAIYNFSLCKIGIVLRMQICEDEKKEYYGKIFFH